MHARPKIRVGESIPPRRPRTRTALLVQRKDDAREAHRILRMAKELVREEEDRIFAEEDQAGA